MQPGSEIYERSRCRSGHNHEKKLKRLHFRYSTRTIESDQEIGKANHQIQAWPPKFPRQVHTPRNFHHISNEGLWTTSGVAVENLANAK